MRDQSDKNAGLQAGFLAALLARKGRLLDQKAKLLEDFSEDQESRYSAAEDLETTLANLKTKEEELYSSKIRVSELLEMLAQARMLVAEFSKPPERLGSREEMQQLRQNLQVHEKQQQVHEKTLEIRALEQRVGSLVDAGEVLKDEWAANLEAKDQQITNLKKVLEEQQASRKDAESWIHSVSDKDLEKILAETIAKEEEIQQVLDSIQAEALQCETNLAREQDVGKDLAITLAEVKARTEKTILAGEVAFYVTHEITQRWKMPMKIHFSQNEGECTMWITRRNWPRIPRRVPVADIDEVKTCDFDRLILVIRGRRCFFRTGDNESAEHLVQSVELARQKNKLTPAGPQFWALVDCAREGHLGWCQ